MKAQGKRAKYNSLNFVDFLDFCMKYEDPGVGLQRTFGMLKSEYSNMMENRHAFGKITSREVPGDDPWQRTGNVTIQLGIKGGEGGLVRWVTPYGQEILFILDYVEPYHIFNIKAIYCAKVDRAAGEPDGDNWLVDSIMPRMAAEFGEKIGSEINFEYISLAESSAAFAAAKSELVKQKRQASKSATKSSEVIAPPFNGIKIVDVTEAGQDS